MIACKVVDDHNDEDNHDDESDDDKGRSPEPNRLFF